MSQVQIVKQRVCIAIFTVGLSLAAFGELGCSPEQNHMAHTPANEVTHVVITRG